MNSPRNELQRAFANNEEGTIAIIFALCLLAVMLVTGLAIDVGRMFHAERKLASAVDAAALAAAKALRDGSASDERVREIATAFFEDNMKGGGNYAEIKSLAIEVDRSRNAVTVNAEGDVPTTFFNLAGVQSVSVPRSSVAMFDTKDIELGLQLDVTGSMAGTKLRDLKAAVDDLLDIMLPDSGTTNRVRIGLAPFASGVNAGDYALAVSGGRATNGCVYERRDISQQATDAPPSGTNALKARSDLGSPDACPSSARVQALTSDKSLLSRTVNGWDTYTSTAGHLGAAWAWYLVSPQWSSIWPSASRPANYSDGKTMKVVILMTDGEYNVFGGKNSGSTSATSSKRYAQDTCLAMREKGVVVYSIGFKLKPAEKTELQNCASDGSKFYDAANGEELRSAFKSIAAELNNLRLSF